MHIIIISSEQLFRDGVVSLLAGQATTTAGSNIRECIRSSSLCKDTVVVVDLRFATERDLDYLVGAQEFGSFQVVFIADVEASVSEGIQPTLSRSDSGAELLGRIQALRNLGEDTNHSNAGVVATGPVVGLTNFRRPRGRPKTQTNSLPLSARQYEAALLASQGRTNSQIAEIMNIREQTVKNVLGTVLKKLDCQKRSQLGNLLTAPS